MRVHICYRRQPVLHYCCYGTRLHICYRRELVLHYWRYCMRIHLCYRRQLVLHYWRYCMCIRTWHVERVIMTRRRRYFLGWLLIVRRRVGFITAVSPSPLPFLTRSSPHLWRWSWRLLYAQLLLCSPASNNKWCRIVKCACLGSQQQIPWLLMPYCIISNKAWGYSMQSRMQQ